jgi:hypothetical protein
LDTNAPLSFDPAKAERVRVLRVMEERQVLIERRDGTASCSSWGTAACSRYRTRPNWTACRRSSNRRVTSQEPGEAGISAETARVLDPAIIIGQLIDRIR